MSALTANGVDTQFDVVETPNQIARKRKAFGFRVILISAAAFTIAALVTLLWTILKDGWSYLSWHLITDMPSRKSGNRRSQLGALGHRLGHLHHRALCISDRHGVRNLS